MRPLGYSKSWDAVPCQIPAHWVTLEMFWRAVTFGEVVDSSFNKVDLHFHFYRYLACCLFLMISAVFS